jgi:hypothetical protein
MCLSHDPHGVYVTTWSVRRRHIGGDGLIHTLCREGVVRPGCPNARMSPPRLTQEIIDALPLCKRCVTLSRKARPDDIPNP